MRKIFLHDTYGENELFWNRIWDNDWERKCTSPPQVMPALVARIGKYLKPDMLLLEGGCGDARYVRYFEELGVRTIGIDYARSTVIRINDLFPDLDVREGDIRNLEFPDNSFDAYYSGGVIEHFEDGIGPQLAEAHRVVKNGGYFFVTVPHMNLSRRCEAMVFSVREKTGLNGWRSFHREGLQHFITDSPPKDFHFHEYFFSSCEMRTFLSAYGFRIVDEMPFSSTHGLCDIALYRKLIGADRPNRTMVNKLFAAPLRSIRNMEDSQALSDSFLGSMFGWVFGNLKLYVCLVEK